VERRAARHHLVEERHRHGNQMCHSITAGCWMKGKDQHIMIIIIIIS